MMEANIAEPEVAVEGAAPVGTPAALDGVPSTVAMLVRLPIIFVVLKKVIDAPDASGNVPLPAT